MSDTSRAGGTLVAGLGNDLRRDDGVGPAVALRVARAERPGVRVLVHGGEPTDLIEVWRGCERAVVVDAMHSGAPAGTSRRFDAGAAPLPAEPFGVSSHLLPLAQVVELARVLDALPGRLLVFGVEGADFASGEGLSPAVAAAVERVATEVLDEIGAALAP